MKTLYRTGSALCLCTVSLFVVGCGDGPVEPTIDPGHVDVARSPTANQPPVPNPGGPYTGTVGQPVQFDGSGSTDPEGQTLTYRWEFGDGTRSTEVSPTHTYSAPGTYTVKLTVRDASGVRRSATTTAEITEPFAADPGGPYTGIEGQAIQFDGSGSTDPEGDPLTYAWDFGDGTTGAGAQPTHVYNDNGTYTVTLTVSDAAGDSGTASTTATVANAAPSVDAGPDAQINAGEAFDLLATFSDPGVDDSPWTYTVHWGDGAADLGATTDPSTPIGMSHTYPAGGTYTVHVEVVDKDGGEGTASLTVTVGGGDSPPVILLAAGDIARCDRTKDELTAALLDGLAGTVVALGDNAYPDGTLEEYLNCYDPTWGRHKDRTWPAVGNHEYHTPGAEGYFAYWGAKAGQPGEAYYSFDLGEWHIVVLNSNCDEIGGCGAGSPQLAWLEADLAANPAQCTLAVFHHPLFWSSGIRTELTDFWIALYEAGVELILNGHRHNYERFAPQTPEGILDPDRGIRQIIAGTGGASLNPHGDPAPNSEIRAEEYGILRLTLAAGHFTWEFVPVPGRSGFTDSGSGTCH